MTHTDVRDALTEGRADDAVTEHLDGCPSCRSFATALQHVERLAPTLTARPPTDLADRILAPLGDPAPPARRATGRDARDASPVSAFWAGTARRVTAMAAALLLVVGLAAVLQRTGERDPREVVLASAERTTAEGSARLTVDADAEVIVDVPDAPAGEVPSAPDLSHVPDEMHAHVEHEWARIMADFEVRLREFQEQVDASMRDAQRQIEEAQRQMDEALRRMQESFGGSPGASQGGDGWTPPQPPSPPSGPGGGADGGRAEDPAPPTLPSSLSTRVTVEASGSVAFGDQVRLEGTAGPEGAVDAGAARFGLAVDGDAAAYLGPDGSWTGLPGPAGPLGGVLLDADAVARVLSAPVGEVQVAGTTEIDGHPVRRYRFDVDSQALGDLSAGTDLRMSAGWTAEAWIDGEGRTRRLELTADLRPGADASTTWRTRLAMRLSDFGTDQQGRAPSVSGRADVPTSASLLLYPFGPNVAATSRTVAEVDG